MRISGNKLFFPGVATLLAGIAILGSLPAGAAYFDYLQPLPETPLIPKDNPMSEEKISLGKKLFFDRRLSSNNKINCNDCHNLNSGGDNNQASGIGVSGKPTRRNPPTLLNIGLQTVLYWDGRARTLEEQIVDHLKDPDIMGYASDKALTEELGQDREYIKVFMNTFKSAHPLKMENVAKALSSFLRALMTPDSPFDRFIKGDKNAISKKAQRGIQIFNDTGCLACHFGVNFAGPAPGPAMGIGDGFYELFPNTLGSEYDKSHKLVDDLGRFEFSREPHEKYMWRVPPLRNIELTAPYFHNGSAKTLEEAVVIMAKTQTDKVLTKDEIEAVVEFLKSLTGKKPSILDN